MPDFGERVVAFDNARCIRQTDAVIQVYLEDEANPIWFPQSQVDDLSDVWKHGQTGSLIVSECHRCPQTPDQDQL